MLDSGRRIEYVALWAMAIFCFGLGVTGTAVLGFERSSWLLLATVFAAVTAEYDGQRRCDTSES